MVKKLLVNLDEEIEKQIDLLVFDLYEIADEHRDYILNFAKINI